MTIDEMAKCIRYLKAYYPKWDFNINDSFMLQVWFQSFEEIETSAFLQVLKNYCKENTFPPSSPTDILKMIPKELNVDAAWELVVDIMNRNNSNDFFLKELHKTNKLVYECIKSFDMYKRNDSFGHDCMNFIRRSFKRQYQQRLDSFKVKYVSNSLVHNQFLLG